MTAVLAKISGLFLPVARRDGTGYLILGRVDDVINVIAPTFHRRSRVSACGIHSLGTAVVAERAFGEASLALLCCTSIQSSAIEGIGAQLGTHIETEIGKFARAKDVTLCSDCLKPDREDHEAPTK